MNLIEVFDKGIYSYCMLVTEIKETRRKKMKRKRDDLTSSNQQRGDDTLLSTVGGRAGL